MCNAYNLRHRNEAILDIARAMQLAVADLPEFPPRHRIGITSRRPQSGKLEAHCNIATYCRKA